MLGSLDEDEESYIPVLSKKTETALSLKKYIQTQYESKQ